MRYLLKALARRLPARARCMPMLAQDEGTPVPVEKAAYHWPIFSNDYIMMLRVYMRPGKGSNFHIHSIDQISVLVEAGANEGQVYGKARTDPRQGRDARQRRLHPLSPRRHSPTARPTSARRPVRQYRRRAAQAGARQLHAAGARGSGLHAAVRQRARARLAARSSSRAQTAAADHARPRPGCASSSMATSSPKSITGADGPRAGAAVGRFLLAGAPARRARSATAARSRIKMVEFELK